MTTYSVLDLGTETNRRTFAYGNNDSGVSVGEAILPGNRFLKGASWDSAGIKTNLGVLGNNKFSRGEEINNSGKTTGSSNFTPSPTSFHAFYHDGVGLTDLGTLSGSGSSYGISINSSDTVVGYSNFTGGADDKYHAFAWSGGGLIDRHPTFGGDTSRAEGINNPGQIVGYGTSSTSGPHTVAFLYSAGAYSDLGILPDPGWGLGAPQGSEAYAINNIGVISGASYVQGGLGVKVYRAWIKEGGSFTDLGDLGLGGKHSRALGINDSKVVVGEANTTFGDSQRHAFVWTQAEGMKDLNTLIPGISGWLLVQAYDVNSSGQITGFGVHDGKPRGFLLTPTASPIPPPGRPSINLLTAQNTDLVADNGVFDTLPAVASERFIQRLPAFTESESAMTIKQTPSAAPTIRIITAANVAAEVVNSNLQDPLS